ncbi:unnamed protein product [Rhizoctonia solani]|uniref:Uncharacterized protein n=1 Tax=Rhizoctonia solani TaxID=456999 RepID=A0A8H3DTZ9_9AGAM|nr:unnamed protein product [Rhizoctonia solani]
MKLHELPDELHDLVHYSLKGGSEDFPEMRQFLGVTVRGDANLIWNKYKKLAKHEDKTAWREWVAQRKDSTAARREADEKRELLETRRRQIEERLLEAGWEAADLKFKPWSDGIQQWHELVEMPKQPRPLTDRVWKNLYAKLKPLLETNREERIEREYIKRKIRRRDWLEGVLYKLKRTEPPPLLKVKPRQSNSETLSSVFRSVTKRDVFPFVHDALKLPLIQQMNEDDIGIEEFREGIKEHQSKVEDFITDWQDKTRVYLVNLIQEEDREYSEILQPPKNMDLDAFARLSDDQKLLLRADSLFYVDTACFRTLMVDQPYDYGTALQTAYPSLPEYQPYDLGTEPVYEPEAPDLTVIHRYATAQEVARDLLEDLGKPNASFVEVNQLHYSCQRCHDKSARDWTSMLEHYINHKQIQAKVDKHASLLAEEGIVYRNVHDRSFSNDRPMIKPARRSSALGARVPVKMCKLCERKPIDLNVTLSIPRLEKHLLEVHNVNDPKPEVHYSLTLASMFGPSPGSDYEIEEPDEDNEEVEADNAPEEVPVEYYWPESSELEDEGEEEWAESDLQ